MRERSLLGCIIILLALLGKPAVHADTPPALVGHWAKLCWTYPSGSTASARFYLYEDGTFEFRQEGYGDCNDSLCWDVFGYMAVGHWDATEDTIFFSADSADIADYPHSYELQDLHVPYALISSDTLEIPHASTYGGAFVRQPVHVARRMKRSPTVLSHLRVLTVNALGRAIPPGNNNCAQLLLLLDAGGVCGRKLTLGHDSPTGELADTK